MIRRPAQRPARVLLTTVTALLLAVGLAACGGDGGEAASAEAAGEGGGAFPRTVQHAMGSTEIPEQPQTVVTLDTSFTDAAIALEAKVIGRINYAGTDGYPEYLGEAAQTYGGEAVSVGELTAPDLPTIAELQPDLIVSAKVRHESIYDQLSQIAPTVFSETTGATWKDNLRMLGEALGKEELAEEKIGAYEERAAALGDTIEALPGEPPSMSIARFVGGPIVRLYSSNSFTGIVQADIGLPRREGQPDAEDKIMVELSQEEILELDADHIFVTVWDDGTGESQAVADKFMANPLWDKLQGEIHPVSDTEWMTSVSLQGAHQIIEDIAKAYGVEAPPRT